MTCAQVIVPKDPKALAAHFSRAARTTVGANASAVPTVPEPQTPASPTPLVQPSSVGAHAQNVGGGFCATQPPCSPASRSRTASMQYDSLLPGYTLRPQPSPAKRRPLDALGVVRQLGVPPAAEQCASQHRLQGANGTCASNGGDGQHPAAQSGSQPVPGCKEGEHASNVLQDLLQELGGVSRQGDGASGGACAQKSIPVIDLTTEGDALPSDQTGRRQFHTGEHWRQHTEQEWGHVFLDDGVGLKQRVEEDEEARAQAVLTSLPLPPELEQLYDTFRVLLPMWRLLLRRHLQPTFRLLAAAVAGTGTTASTGTGTGSASTSEAAGECITASNGVPIVRLPTDGENGSASVNSRSLQVNGGQAVMHGKWCAEVSH